MSEGSDGSGIIAFSSWENVIFWKAQYCQETGINLTGQGVMIFWHQFLRSCSCL